MSTDYFIGCMDCKIVRHLDSFYTMALSDVKGREDALKLADELKKDSFRSALLISFMYEHKGHNCTVFSEHDDVEPFHGDDDWAEGVQEQGDQFWKT